MDTVFNDDATQFGVVLFFFECTVLLVSKQPSLYVPDVKKYFGKIDRKMK